MICDFQFAICDCGSARQSQIINRKSQIPIMPYELGVAEVGPAEYPLIEVLRETVFGEFGHRSHSAIATQLADRPDLLVLMAHLEGNPIGFSAGYRRTVESYYVNYMAVLRDYRGQGIGKRFLKWHEDFARARGYGRIEFTTFNHFPGMMRLGARTGYLPIGLEQHQGTGNDLAVRFGKSLGKEADKSADEELLTALAAGKQVVGMERTARGELRVIWS
jgi:GNAT superfamily N-acetyltransferase